MLPPHSRFCCSEVLQPLRQLPLHVRRWCSTSLPLEAHLHESRQQLGPDLALAEFELELAISIVVALRRIAKPHLVVQLHRGHADHLSVELLDRQVVGLAHRWALLEDRGDQPHEGE